jgi:outer membrane protein OmpA-like peptidoglycan-associated protein
VQAELVLDGVPRDAIEVTGLGAKNPLVATATGVREPQNRRVEIVLN